MSNCSIDIVKKAFKHEISNRIPKGELWLGKDIFRRLNLEDDIKGHFEAVKILGQDIVSFPLSEGGFMNNITNYRYFSFEEIFEATKINDELFLMVTIDGPIQRISQRMGLMKVLGHLSRKCNGIKIEIEEDFKRIIFLINKCLEFSINAIVIADDIASENNLIINPKLFNDLFSNFYGSLISEIHKKDLYVLFHSCGNINLLIPTLISFGFDGLASIQDRSNDLLSIKEKFGHHLTIMGGIDSEILELSEFPIDKLMEFKKRIKRIASGGGFILSSAGGLYRGDFVDRIEKIYKITDRIVDNYKHYN